VTGRARDRAERRRRRYRGTCPEEDAWPAAVIAAGDIEVLSRRVAALESLVGCLLWAVTRHELRP
jgi:hypothetical protein